MRKTKKEKCKNENSRRTKEKKSFFAFLQKNKKIHRNLLNFWGFCRNLRVEILVNLHRQFNWIVLKTKSTRSTFVFRSYLSLEKSSFFSLIDRRSNKKVRNENRFFFSFFFASLRARKHFSTSFYFDLFFC